MQQRLDLTRRQIESSRDLTMRQTLDRAQRQRVSMKRLHVLDRDLEAREIAHDEILWSGTGLRHDVVAGERNQMRTGLHS